MLHDKKYDLWVQEIILAINLATAANFRSKNFLVGHDFPA